MFRKFFFILCFIANSLFSQNPSLDKQPQIIIENKPKLSKIKDLTRIVGYKNNQLIGYGIVIGLKGTGDTKYITSREVLSRILQNFQIQLDVKNFEPKNVANVIVTAEIPPFAKKGDRITCIVSSIGDAKSIQEGILLQTPLYASNGKIYAVAQGKLMLQSQEKNSTAILLDGAIVEKDLEEIAFQNQVHMQLLNFDIEVLYKIFEKLRNTFNNLEFKIEGTSIIISFSEKNDIIKLLTDILNTEIEMPVKNKIYIHQQLQLIVLSGEFTFTPLVISKSEKTHRYEKVQQEAYQGIYIRKMGGSYNNLIFLNAKNIQEFVKEINQYQFSFEDLVVIIQSLVEMGFLQGEIFIR